MLGSRLATLGSGAWPARKLLSGLFFSDPEDVDCTPPQHHTSVSAPSLTPTLPIHPQRQIPEGTRELEQGLVYPRAQWVTSRAQCQALRLAPRQPDRASPDGSSVQERSAYLFQPGNPYLSRGLYLQLVGGSTQMCSQQGLISVQDGLEENQHNPEDLGSGPYTNKESSLETPSRCSKEPSAQPAAISFLGALRIPVRSLQDGGKRGAL